MTGRRILTNWRAPNTTEVTRDPIKTTGKNTVNAVKPITAEIAKPANPKTNASTSGPATHPSNSSETWKPETCGTNARLRILYSVAVKSGVYTFLSFQRHPLLWQQACRNLTVDNLRHNHASLLKICLHSIWACDFYWTMWSKQSSCLNAWCKSWQGVDR